MLDIALRNLFSSFNMNNIDYCMIRDFNEPEIINNSEDIDILVRESNFHETKKLLDEQGWYTPRINPNAYGHIQYYKCNSKKIYKLDILRDMYFSDGKYKLNFEKINVKYTEKNGIRVPSNEFALLFLVLHCVLDKNSISPKNATQLNELVSSLNETNNWWYHLAKGIIDSDDYKLVQKNKYITEIENTGIVEVINNSLWRLKRRFLGRVWRFKTHENSFAILGVDGTGKSSTIDILKRYYGDDLFVQYMGFRSYTSRMAKKWATDSAPKIKIPGVNLFLQQISCYFEMINRFRLAKKSRRKVVIFDRFAWEANDNARNGFVKIISWMFFKAMFPKPHHIIYLYCPTEISLSRKNDIDDIDGFVKMKSRIDHIYKTNKKALILDTSIDNKDVVVDKTITYICVKTQGYVK